jgi:uncharacterized protein (DUF885 family)
VAATGAPDVAAAGVDDERLAEVLGDAWEFDLREHPVFASELGDHRYDDRLADNSEGAIKRRRAALAGFAARVAAIDAARLSARDRVTRALFLDMARGSLAQAVCEDHLWSVSPGDNEVIDANLLARRHDVVTPRDGANLIARYQHVPRIIDTRIAQLEAGAARGLIANAESLRRTLAMVDAQLAQPLDEWAVMAPADAARDGWSSAERDAFAAGVRFAVGEHIAPAYRRYRAALAELVPQGRDGDRVGLGGLELGAACYRAKIEFHTGMAKTADELHALGLAEIARINAEMRQLGRSLFGADDLASIVARLRADPALYHDDAASIVAAAERALARANATVPAWFGVLPQTACLVVEIPAYQAPYTMTAYYRPPDPNGSRPGEYFVNTYRPETRPRFEMEVLAYHESVPGHHLQVAIAQERKELPAFRRYGGVTAFAEGWALYAERLADEMGMYTGDLDRMGMLSYDAWRAARLVVDTGLHAKGWSRERAERFMLEHTALRPDNVRNEVDRYLVVPGQALAYKVGQLEILRLRKMAQDRLGEAFDIKRFHDAVLTGGAVSLPVLAAQVETWVAASGGDPATVAR